MKVHGILEYVKINSGRSYIAAIDITNDQDRRNRCVNAKTKPALKLHLFVCILHALCLFTSYFV